MAIQTNFPAVKPALLLDFANTKRLDPRITFTRTTTATYYDGVTTAKAEENLFLYSQEFDNITGWSPIRSSISANATTAPDGTNTADSLIEDSTASNNHYVQPNTVAAGNYNGVVVNGSIYSFSVFAKANTRSQVCLGFWDGSTVHTAFFDLSGGTVLSSSGVTASIVNAGNGWYRCVGVRTNTNTTMALSIQLSVSGSTTYTGNGTSGIYIWGAQLEQRSSVTAYTATTTQAITNYIPVLQTASAGQARFDHNPVTRESLGLLAEEARTNLATYSAQFDNASWAKNALSITSDTIVAPDGTLTGDKAIANTSAAEHYFEQVCSTTTNQSYTQTIYVKRGEESQFGMMVVAVGSSTTTSLAIFSISVGGVVTANGGSAGLISSYSATNVGNGWYRCSIVYTLNGTVTSHRMRIYPGSNSASAVGNGFNGSYFWGAQLEAGAFPTSYIPTVAAQVTRNADVANIAGNNFTSWYNASEGTVYIEAQTAATNGGFMTLQDGSVANYIRLNRESGNSKLRLLIEGSSGVQVDIASVANVTVNSFVKGILSYKFNDAAVCLNGESAVTDTSVVLPSTPTELNIGFGKYLTYVNGTIKKLAYYRKRLTNSQLQNLTS